MKEAVFYRTMVELITNIKVILSPLMELEKDIFEEVELKCELIMCSHVIPA